MEAQVSAFQMDDDAILTVKDGETLLTSGVYKAFSASTPPKVGDIMHVDFGGDVGRVRCSVQAVDDDPVKCGPPARPGQRRFSWSGVFSLEA